MCNVFTLVITQCLELKYINILIKMFHNINLLFYTQHLSITLKGASFYHNKENRMKINILY